MMYTGQMDKNGGFFKHTRMKPVLHTIGLLLLIVILITTYRQWASKTRLYMTLHNNYQWNAAAAAANLDYYLHSQDEEYLTIAYIYAAEARKQARAFRYYFGEKLGGQLADNLSTVMEIPYGSPYNDDPLVVLETLSVIHEGMKKVVDATVAEGSWRIAYIPRNPFGRREAKSLLSVTEKVLAEREKILISNVSAIFPQHLLSEEKDKFVIVIVHEPQQCPDALMNEVLDVLSAHSKQIVQHYTVRVEYARGDYHFHYMYYDYLKSPGYPLYLVFDTEDIVIYTTDKNELLQFFNCYPIFCCSLWLHLHLFA